MTAPFRIATDRANHHALKAVLAGLRFTGRPFEVDLVVPQTVPKVPWMTGGGLTTPIFCATEMAKLLAGANLSVHEETWLEWETSVMNPSLAPLYRQRLLTADGEACLKRWEDEVASRAKSSPNDRSIVDVIVWSSLVPAFCRDGILTQDQRRVFPCLSDWFQSFSVDNASLIDAAFVRLGVQEAADFLRVKRTYAMTPVTSKKFYVTTPIYYVNAKPHIGHVYSTLIADTLARYHRLKGNGAFFMTGTDEHGQKVAQAAAEKGLTPKQFTDGVAAEFQQCFREMHFSHDHFIRTTDEAHEQTVQELWKLLESKGDIYLGRYEGWYCISDEAFVTAKDVADGVDKNGNACKVSIESGQPVSWVVEENYMFRLSRFRDQLLAFYRAHPQCIVPEFRRQEIINFVEKGLIDLSVSRKKETCSWGIPVPGSDKHVIYVWLDALSNYYTTSRLDPATHQISPVDQGLWPADVHVIGKDILKFHAIYWPAFLMSANLPLPKKIVAHGWWTKDKRKISKSLGNAFDPSEKAEKFGLDSLKFFLLRESSFSDDGDYSDRNMVARLNSELADTLGNLLLRCVSRKINPSGLWPMVGSLSARDQEIVTSVDALAGNVDHFMLIPDVQRALIAIFDVLRDINSYTTENAPWKLVMEDPERLKTVLYVMMESVRVCVLLLSPVFVETHARMLDLLGVPLTNRSGIASMKFGVVAAGTPIGPDSGDVIFPKAEMPASPTTPASAAPPSAPKTKK